MIRKRFFENLVMDLIEKKLTFRPEFVTYIFETVCVTFLSSLDFCFLPRACSRLKNVKNSDLFIFSRP